MLHRKFDFVKAFFFLSFLFLSNNCIDPVSPEFEFKEGLLFVEGFASTSSGASFVIITESVIEFGVYGTKFLQGATVSFVNSNTGEEVVLTEELGSYVPPDDFVVSVGQTWEVEILLADGRMYKSEPDTVIEPVEIKNIIAQYNPELLYRESTNKFVPGHQVSVSFDDPADKENYYYWSFRSFENLDFCEKCYESVFRNDACVTNPYAMPPPTGSDARNYYDYSCESDCWKIRFPESITIYSDKFSDGNSVNQMPIANILLYTKEDVVVEVQQFSLPLSTYDYYKTLKDIIDNNSGFNAPPPAGLIGNIYSPNDSEDFIFGRFTAASTSTAYIFIDRTDISELPIETREPLKFEGCETCPPGTCPFGDCSPVTSAPCSERRYRTAIVPPGWIEN
ncbi:hypothetical protein GGR42_001444 [Saonia flava]|uniref:DUF4249 domain-containing protein n=1 Tax=Saonia flava TaxID=523696 RepID=A0A846QWM9_9FLAO|nr:DUF4249 domain-containing protein [Saonia flava]NJB70982.1 hypothetical protein [Saonia flava]